MTTPYPIHPLAAAFPEMSPEEFADLKSSIADHGLRHEIVLLDDQILDGRNRYKACLETGIPPIFREFDPAKDGDLPVSFVADENLNRRNLTTSQRAAIAAELEPYFQAAIDAEKARIAKEKADKKAAAKEKAKEQSKPAAPTGGQYPENEEFLADKLATLHQLDKTSSVLRGCVASATGKGLDENPFEEGHPARDMWKRGWEMETARAIQTPDEEPEQEPETEGEDDEQQESEGETSTGTQRARDRAASVTGVSPRLVSDARTLKETAPEEFKKVKDGEKTVHQAKQDAKALGESISPYRAECADLVEANHGEEFAQAIRNATVLKNTPELEAFVRLTIPSQKEVIPFVVKGWKVADAVKFLRGEFDVGTTAGELISYANAKGVSVAVEIGNFTITIEKSK